MKSYICIDLKSFYASVECVLRGLDPMDTNLVVADESRTTKTICLAVSPSLKAYGIGGRARLFEVVEKVNRVNAQRITQAPGRKFNGESYRDMELKENSGLKLSYIVAPPRMAKYMKFSTKIYNIYLKYVAPEDIHVYSVDEVFMDVTHYLKTYGLSAVQLAKVMIQDIMKQTGIVATAGVGTNMYLAKVAMDIVAKHTEADEDGVRIAVLDEMSYRRKLWEHRPITDFWRVGAGYAKRLAALGMYTMGDVARCSLGGDNEFYNEDLLYKTFGINAELLIDHAWGYEPCTMDKIKAYKPQTNSLSSGQVLSAPYDFDKAKVVIREMLIELSLDLVRKGLVTDQMVINVGYDICNVDETVSGKKFTGSTKSDHYKRQVPPPAHGSVNLKDYTASSMIIEEAVCGLFDSIVDKDLYVRRMNVVANHVIPKESVPDKKEYEQLSLFTDYEKEEQLENEEIIARSKEEKIQKAMIDIKDKYGKNAILKGVNFEEGATGIMRNNQIGGHKA